MKKESKMTKEKLVHYLNNNEVKELLISIDVSESEEETKRVFVHLEDLQINALVNGELQLVVDGKVEDA